MAFCRYCGKPLNNGEMCGCRGQSQNMNQGEPVYPGNPENGFVMENPKPKKGLIIIAVIAVIVIAAGVIAAIFIPKLLDKDKDKDKKSSGSAKSTVETYAKNLFSKKGGETVCKLKYTDDVIKSMKKEDEWDDIIDDYNDFNKDFLEDYEISIKDVKKGSKLSDDELESAEEYFNIRSEEYDIKEKIKVKSGFEYIIKYQIIEDDDEETEKRKICVVDVDGEGWKIIELSADDLEYFYSD